jgi:hypothetical protein
LTVSPVLIALLLLVLCPTYSFPVQAGSKGGRFRIASSVRSFLPLLIGQSIQAQS